MGRLVCQERNESCCERVTTGIYCQKRNILAGDLKMANYIDYQLGGYIIRLRPSDPIRSFLGTLGLDAWLLYFNTSYIFFDLIITVPDDEIHKNIDDTIEFEWVLCDGNMHPIQNKGFSLQSFSNTFGNNEFHFSTNKKKAKELIKAGEMIKRGKGGGYIGVRKYQAINIGRLPRPADYNVVMKFKNKNGDTETTNALMANFTVFIRDRFMHAVWLGVLVVLVTALVTLMLKTCGAS